MEAALSIIVYEGSPVDAPEYRHTALFLDISGQSTTLLDIKGAIGFFRVETRSAVDPIDTMKFIKKIPVGVIQGQTKLAIEEEIKSTPLLNTERGWNCQSWVGDALTKLSDRHWITDDERLTAIDVMAGVIVEAPDEA